MPAPDTLNVVFLDDWSAMCLLETIGEATRAQKRLVQITLTPEQQKMLTPKLIGKNKGRPMFESIADAWLEQVHEKEQE